MRGIVIKELRERHNCSRKELADYICVSVSELQSWEEGWYLTLPSSGEIGEMASYFKMSEEQLRLLIELDEDDYDEESRLRTIDYVDSLIRLSKFIRDKKRDD